MRHGHLGQRRAEEQGDHRNDRIRKDDGRAGDVHRKAAGEEEARADRTAERHHDLLRRRELPREHLFAADLVVVCGARHVTSDRTVAPAA